MSLEGSATGAGGSTAQAEGSIFIGSKGEVDALTLRVARSEFARGPLRIATLNRQGILDTDVKKAFLFTDPAQKLAHPVTYTCRQGPG